MVSDTGQFCFIAGDDYMTIGAEAGIAFRMKLYFSIPPRRPEMQLLVPNCNF